MFGTLQVPSMLQYVENLLNRSCGSTEEPIFTVPSLCFWKA